MAVGSGDRIGVEVDVGVEEAVGSGMEVGDGAGGGVGIVVAIAGVGGVSNRGTEDSELSQLVASIITTAKVIPVRVLIVALPWCVGFTCTLKSSCVFLYGEPEAVKIG